MRRFLMIALTFALATVLADPQQVAPSTDAPVPGDQFSSKKVNPPQLLHSEDAVYSIEAREKRINGHCVVSITIDIMGIPQDMKLTHCTDPSFVMSTLETVSRYRFKPATTEDGKPVAIKMNVEIGYHIDAGIKPVTPVRYDFFSPPGVTSSEPDADGVYPLTRLATPPSITKFSDEGYGNLAIAAPGNSVCSVTLTISAKGKPSDLQVIHCERPTLDEPVSKSLLKSQYKPGMVNRKAVPMRASLEIELGNFPSY